MDVWQWFTLVLGIITVVALVFAWWARKNPVPVEGILTAETQIVPLRVPRSEKLKVDYDGVKLTDPYICTIALTNTGPTQVQYVPDEVQAFNFTVTPGEHAIHDVFHFLHTPPRQVQEIERPGALKSSQSLPRIGVEVAGGMTVGKLDMGGAYVGVTPQPPWNRVQFLDDSKDIVIPLRGFILDRGETMHWLILSDGAPRAVFSGKIAGTTVLMRGEREATPFMVDVARGVFAILFGPWPFVRSQ